MSTNNTSFLSQMKPQKLSLLLVAVLLAVIVIAGFWVFGIVKAHLQQNSTSFARTNGAPIPVRVVEVESRSVSATIVTQATLVATQDLPIFPVVEAVVQSVDVEVGSLVKEGDVLVTFKSELLAARVDLDKSLTAISREEYKEAERTYLKIKDMYERKLVSQDEFIKASLAEKKAKAKLINSEYSELKSGFDYSQVVLRAPVSGIVTEIKAFPGTLSRKTAPVITLSVTNPIYVEAQVAQRNFGELRLGQKVRFSLDAWKDKVFNADVVRIGHAVEQKNNTLSVIARLDNPDLSLRPGMIGVATIDLSNENNSSLRVPAIALLANNGSNAFVFKVDANKQVHLTEVAVSGYEQGYVGIRTGLVAGDQVVVAGQQGLMDGDKVEIGNAL